MSRHNFPPNTVIKDFAYAENHPLRLGTIPSESSSDDYAPRIPSISSDEINCRAVALFDFVPENDNEVRLAEGQVIWILYRHGQGWLVAEDPELGENGLVPEEYVEIFYDDDTDDVAKPFMPQILLLLGHTDDSEWEDLDDSEPVDELLARMKIATIDTPDTIHASFSAL